MAANALIFDLDGTIWHSAPWFAAALSDGHAATASKVEAELTKGGNIVSALKARRMSRERLIAEGVRLGGPPPLFAGIEDALANLKAKGTPLAVATSLPGSLAVPMLDAASLADVFDAVVHAGTCRTPKPHPRSILLAMEMLGVRPSGDVFYVGDRQTDAEAAERAGISIAWVTHGYEQPAPGSGIVTINPADLTNL